MGSSWNRHKWIAGLICIAWVISACIPQGLHEGTPSAFSGWEPVHLRYLQEPEKPDLPQLIALYTRVIGLDIEIRCDFLALGESSPFDLYLALDTRPGGVTQLPVQAFAGLAWDTLITIPAGSPGQAFDPSLARLESLSPRFIDDELQAARVIQLNRSRIPGNPGQIRLQAFLTRPGDREVFQRTAVFSTGDVAPRAPLLLVFWDVLPAATPAQALRRWDGAHTGPLGGRHGLSVLLQAAAANHIPLVMADLKQPASLAALAALDQLPAVQKGARSGVLLLPEVIAAPSDPSTPGSWGLPQSSFWFAPLPAAGLAEKTAAFAVLEDAHHIQNWQGHRLIPLPVGLSGADGSGEMNAVSTMGFSSDVLARLLRTALSPDPADLVVLGGSLPASPWADFSVAPLVFEYIAQHPWIQPLDGNSLLSFPAQASPSWPVSPACLDLLCTPVHPAVTPYNSQGEPLPSTLTNTLLLARLEQQFAGLPVNQFAAQARQMLQNLAAPTANAALNELRANYLGQAGYLLEAARWAARPEPMADCALDLDLDGAPECRLASEAWLAILKTDGARLVFAAHRGPNGAAQWVGPASQFAVGSSDPSTWQPRLGPAADPNEIPGALARQSQAFEPFEVSIQGQRMVFTAPSLGRVTYWIAGDEFGAAVSSPQPMQTRLPITLAPQDWPYAATPAGAGSSTIARWLPAPRLEGQRWVWAPSQGPGLVIDFEGVTTLASDSFLDTLEWMRGSEDPNRVYPPGHYLPYPLAVIRLEGTNFQVRFKSQ